ncbi:MAG: M14 family metallopeptidase [Cyanobacteria bacterium P01_H01_bin.121]
MDTTVFSPDYCTARAKFRQALAPPNFRHEAFEIEQVAPTGEALTIDVAISPCEQPREIVVISSGLHGVEGFLGSAVQVAWLNQLQFWQSLPTTTQVILIHALNPYGFAWRRRWNEDNIDLNRNFLLPGDRYAGRAAQYDQIRAFFNPQSPPSRPDFFNLEALALVARYGYAALRKTLPVGQYDYPRDLFFGGQAPAKTQDILVTHLARWIGTASRVIHLDFHSGLGRSGTYTLLISDTQASARYQRLRQQFPGDPIYTTDQAQRTYVIRGGIGLWCQTQLPNCQYDYLTVEFGTYPPRQVLRALRAENRAHWWGQPGCNYDWTKQQLVEIFAPRDLTWRSRCLQQGVDLCHRACQTSRSSA